MDRPGRSVRLLVPAVVAIFLVLGTWKGQDDNFPFGPFRMYSTKQELDGEVRSLQLWGLYRCGTAEPAAQRIGEWTNLDIEENFALRRADLEGQLGKLAVEPTVLLSELERTYRRLHPGGFPFDALQLRDRIYDLEDGKAISERFRILGTWRPVHERDEPCPPTT
ncbi:MAG: hypothetical protein M3277_04995 [Actinomycetota bacterium]|nr:hypothetical protein [Actinomycetota bacterium]